MTQDKDKAAAAKVVPGESASDQSASDHSGSDRGVLSEPAPAQVAPDGGADAGDDLVGADVEFEDLGAELASTRADLGALRARGNLSRILRYLTATVLATVLVACSGMSERPANACATPQQCEIEAYSRSR